MFPEKLIIFISPIAVFKIHQLPWQLKNISYKMEITLQFLSKIMMMKHWLNPWRKGFTATHPCLQSVAASEFLRYFADTTKSIRAGCYCHWTLPSEKTKLAANAKASLVCSSILFDLTLGNDQSSRSLTELVLYFFQICFTSSRFNPISRSSGEKLHILDLIRSFLIPSQDVQSKHKMPERKQLIPSVTHLMGAEVEFTKSSSNNMMDMTFYTIQ
ncbi:hypothetical protein FEM48_Zijuj09G0220500 [Ziziphus jujuba var. spinosa]|uniref:Uncharacterized protein n=1 Tax=Ziziphus jujuba var. spinosa TaxID=714518 RepID=A0A978UVK3_ZIZJJ|nr:hypothetical protein FEM48_Zijuj09G0220500 [Ziziphus jujuba var. spinosa]